MNKNKIYTRIPQKSSQKGGQKDCVCLSSSCNNVININLNLIESAIARSQSRPGAELDAIGIAMSKKFRCNEPMRVGSISNFAKKFGTSSKRIRQALESKTGRDILDYDQQRGILAVRSTVGIGYNIPFVVVKDEVYDDSRKRIKKCIIEHQRNADVRIPVRASQKGSLNYMRELLQLGIASNHLIKSVRTYNDWKRQRSFTNTNSEKSSTGNGLYEGISVDMLAKINKISKRTGERLLVKLRELDLFTSITRTELIGQYRSRYEAESVIKDIHAKGDWGAYFVAGHSVRRRVSNRYEMKHTKKSPRFRKIIDPKKQEWKNSKKGNWDRPVVERYKDLTKLYNLDIKEARTEDFCIADVNKYYERQTNIQETIRKDVRALLKDNKDEVNYVDAEVGVSSSDLLKEPDIAKDEDLAKEDGNVVERRKAEIGIGSVEEYNKLVEPIKKQKSKSEKYRDLLYQAAGNNSIKLQLLGQYLLDQNKAMGERLGLDLDKCEQLIRRDKTYQRFDDFKRKYFKDMKAEEKAKGTKLYFDEKHVMRLFNEQDELIQEEFPLTMWEYAYTYSNRKKYFVKKVRMTEFKAEEAAARLQESRQKALEIAIRKNKRNKAVQAGNKELNKMKRIIEDHYRSIQDTALQLTKGLGSELATEVSPSAAVPAMPLAVASCATAAAQPSSIRTNTSIKGEQSSVGDNSGTRTCSKNKSSIINHRTTKDVEECKAGRSTEEDTYFDLLYSIYQEDMNKGMGLPQN